MQKFIDVRTRQEFDTGHIPGALNIDFEDMAFREIIAGLFRDFPYCVYCRTGARSAAAVRMMEEMGFTRVEDYGSIKNFHGTLD